MSREFEAVFENGVLRPLGPVELADHDRVTLAIRAMHASPAAVSEADRLARQQELFRNFSRLVAQLSAAETTEPLADGFSNRQHDECLYDPQP